MVDFKDIYQHQADRYHHMISAEDADGNLFRELRTIINGVYQHMGERIRLVDIGSGTGRFELLLRDQDIEVIALDQSQAMLLQQKKQYAFAEANYWHIVQGDMRDLPIRNKSAEIILAGWSIGHFCGWYPEEWKEQISQVLNQMNRVVKPGGTVVIVETMSTGSLFPLPPNQRLSDYYSWIESEWGFERKVIQTDYQFRSVEEAVDATEFFFGPELTNKVLENHWTRIPEWTGIWAKKIG